jgi:hypothetical protein
MVSVFDLLPRIEDYHSCGMKIGYVAGNYRHTMHKSRRCNERITLTTLVVVHAVWRSVVQLLYQ